MPPHANDNLRGVRLVPRNARSQFAAAIWLSPLNDRYGHTLRVGQTFNLVGGQLSVDHSKITSGVIPIKTPTFRRPFRNISLGGIRATLGRSESDPKMRTAAIVTAQDVQLTAYLLHERQNYFHSESLAFRGIESCR